MTVVWGHVTQGFFQDTFPDATHFAVAAVGGFFVLSGFTIRWIYPAGEPFSFSRYAVERWTRILSVVLPALALTMVLDAVSYRVAPEFYATRGTGLHHLEWRLIANLAGLAQIWGRDITPLSNAPFWSISYELGFYLLYGLWRAECRVLALLAAAVLGPNIVLMLPTWLAGVVVFDVCCSADAAARPAREWTLRVALLAAAGAVVAWIVSAYGAQLIALTFGGLHVSSARVDTTVLGGAWRTFPLFVVAVSFASRMRVRAQPWMRSLRAAAASTFGLYLFHLPMLVLLAALGRYDRSSRWQVVVLSLLPVVVALRATPWTERLKRRMREVRSAGALNRQRTCIDIAEPR